MPVLLRVALTIGGLFLATQTTEAQQTDLELMQGPWEVVYFNDSGRNLTYYWSGNIVELEENQFIYNQDSVMTFELNEETMPPQIDANPADPVKERRYGIYHFNANTLQLCIGGESPDNRPDSLGAREGVLYVELKRPTEEE